MNFNEKLTRHQGNLDSAYELLLESKEVQALETEMLEDEILQDDEIFSRLAHRFLIADGEELGEKNLMKKSFLEWGVEELRAERTPEHTRAWQDDRERPSNKEYWNWDDDRI